MLMKITIAALVLTMVGCTAMPHGLLGIARFELAKLPVIGSKIHPDVNSKFRELTGSGSLYTAYNNAWRYCVRCCGLGRVARHVLSHVGPAFLHLGGH
jgi:hypothetical protein